MWRGARVVGFSAVLFITGCNRPDVDSDPMNNDDEEISGPEDTARDEAAGGTSAGQTQGEHRMARAQIEGKSGVDLSGEASLMEQGGATSIVIRLTDAPEGTHAVHIHENGDCSAPDASSAGEHWNPTNAPHGKRGTGSYHLGDLDNLRVGSDGTGEITINANDISLEPGRNDSALGKAIVVHSGADDFKTQPDGGAGQKIGCGVIESATGTSSDLRTP